MANDNSARRCSNELLIDLIALFSTEAAHAVEEGERVRLAQEAAALSDELALQTSATASRAA